MDPGARHVVAAGPPDTFRGDVERHLRELAHTGRGDNARGRNLHALNVLEWALARDWMRYRPTRDAARWLLMLLDLVGAYADLDVPARLRLPFGRFLELLGRVALVRLAAVTRAATADALARRRPRRRRPPLERAPVAGPVLTVLWNLGYSPHSYRTQVHFEKHSQGRLVRRKIAATVDGAWAEAVREEAELHGPGAALLLAALPPGFGTCYRVIETTLRRSEDSLTANPFAVFYALATDAVRGGRVWEPADALVEGAAYGREDFHLALGRSRHGHGDRRATRGSALAELGLSTYFPRTVELLDLWLVSRQLPELWVGEDAPTNRDETWHTFARRAADDVNGAHRAILRRVDALLARA